MNDKKTLLLLVEDELLIRETLDEPLSEAGFELVIAHNGREALDEMERDMARFRGVISDIHLGDGPDGWEVAHRARQLAPEIPVIYITGAGAHEWAANGVPNSVLVSKPFVPAQIITAVASLLNKTAI